MALVRDIMATPSGAASDVPVHIAATSSATAKRVRTFVDRVHAVRGVEARCLHVGEA
jgi:hypothetical protein